MPPTHLQSKSDRTRTAILDGAEQVFLERGTAGSSMKAVARAAGVTQSLIHHYFGNKDRLAAEVRQRRFRRVFEELRPGLTRAGMGDDFCRDFFNLYFDYVSDNGMFSGHLAWLISDGMLPPEETAGKAGPLVERIAREQGEGRIRADISPECVLLMLWSVIEGWHLGMRQYGHRLGREWSRRGPREVVRDAFCEVLQRGLAALPAEDGAP